MSPDVVRRLFNEQFSTKPAGEGHGIGLASVKNLVFTARGALRVTTELSKGSTFTVYLPARE